MINFSQLFRRAWDICWQNRWLFALGILATLGSANAGGNASISYSFRGEDLGPEFGLQAEEFFRGLAAAWPALLVGTLLLVLLSLLLWLLRLASRGALIAAADALDEETLPGAGVPVRFGAAFRRGAAFLPRLVGLDLLLYGPVLVFFIVTFGLVLLYTGRLVAGILADPGTPVLPAGLGETVFIIATCFCLFGCVAFLWQLFLAFLHPLAQRSIVLADSGVIRAIRHGWQILSRNPGDMILLVLFFFVLGMIFRALVSAILVPLGLLLFVPTFLELLSGGIPTAGQLAGIVAVSLLLALLAQVLSGFFVAYQSTGYTLGYRQLTGKGKAESEPPVPLLPATPYQFEQPAEE
jgi:hypothetical protein